MIVIEDLVRLAQNRDADAFTQIISFDFSYWSAA